MNSVGSVVLGWIEEPWTFTLHWLLYMVVTFVSRVATGDQPEALLDISATELLPGQTATRQAPAPTLS